MIINNELEIGKYRVKYFVKGWYKNTNKAKKTIEEYKHYYKTIENQLSASVKNILRDRHDTHIMNTHFIENNYIMELEEHIWGKANIIFHNATVKHSNDIKDEYWLYDEIYKVSDKIELHIRGMDGGEGWRVHSPNGEHRHVYPNGKVRAHRYD